MAERSQLEFDILVAKDALTAALNGAKTAAGGVESGLVKVGSGFGTINGLAEGLLGTFGKLAALAVAAFGAFSFSEAIKAAEEQETAIKSLNLALAQNQNYSEEASQGMQDFASEMQKTTRFADEVVLSSSAMLGSLTKLNVDGIKKATAASADLAATLGIDLDSATSLVAKSIEGNTGALSRYGIQVRKGANETENYRNVLAALAPFQGRAAADADTFGGAMARMKNQFGEVLEAVGNFIIKSPIVIAAINGMGTVFAKLADFLNSNKDAVISFGSALVTSIGGALISINPIINGILVSFSTLLGMIRLVIQGWSELIKALMSLQGVTEIIAEFVTALLEIPKGITQLLEVMVDLADNSAIVGGALKNAGFDIDGLKESLNNATEGIDKLQVKVAGANIEKLTIGGLETVDKILGKSQDILKNQKNISAEVGKTIVDFGSKSAKVQETIIQNIAASKIQATGFFAEMGELFSGAKSFADRLKSAINDIDPKTGITKLQAEIDKIAPSMVASVTKGAEGFRTALVNTTVAAGNFFVKGLGDALGPWVDMFSRGPEQTKKMIKEFILAIPMIIENIILSIPAIIEALIEAIPELLDHLLNEILSGKFLGKIIDALIRVIVGIPQMIVSILISLMKNLPKILVDLFIKELPRVISELIKSIPIIISEFLKFLPQIVAGFAAALVSGAAGFVGAILAGAASFVGEIISGAGRFITELISKIPVVGGLFGGGGGGGGIVGGIPVVGGIVNSVVESIGGVFDWAKGGGIPGIYAAQGQKIPIFKPKGSDVVPSMLTPGEYVIDRGLTQRLTDYLDKQQSRSNTDVILMQILSALKTPQTVDSQITINKRVFADLILELNRSNARLA